MTLPPELNSYLSSLSLADVRYLIETGSTNAVAMEWAGQGATDPSLVIADRQTEGRGRLGRRWVTEAGVALAFSLLLRPSPKEARCLHLFSPWGAVALCQAMEPLGLKAQIKWPNDVLLDRQKVAGILPESAWEGERLLYAIIGMGVNISRPSVPPANELRYPATSVEAQLGQPVDRWWLLARTLERMLALRPVLGTLQFRQVWQEYLAFQGEWVTIEGVSDPPRLGQVLGLGEDGSLRLASPDGELFSVQAGELSLRPAS